VQESAFAPAAALAIRTRTGAGKCGSLAREAVEVRFFRVRAPGEERVNPALIVGEDEDDIRPATGRGCAGRGRHGEKQNAEDRGCGLPDGPKGSE
jgi:hypothetical protein